MDIFDPQLIFSPDKPFYPLVMSYVCQIHGFLDLASRGLYQRFERFCQKQTNFSLSRHELIQLFCKTLDEKNRKTAEEVVSGGKMGMMFKQGLASSISTGIKVDTEVLAGEIFEHPTSAIRYFNRISAGGLLILAWENTEADHMRDPVWEFFRHSRNAAAHRGFFNFYQGEPKRPAKWRTLEIIQGLQGQPLFPDPPKKGFLGIGDVLYLLADIEKEFY
jgi:hypothetical protein